VSSFFDGRNFLLAVASTKGEAVTAVAVSRNTIVDVGDSRRILAKKTAHTKVVDLGGTTLAP
jgi:predicted amidohydrolase YtcJ